MPKAPTTIGVISCYLKGGGARPINMAEMRDFMSVTKAPERQNFHDSIIEGGHVTVDGDGKPAFVK